MLCHWGFHWRQRREFSQVENGQQSVKPKFRSLEAFFVGLPCFLVVKEKGINALDQIYVFPCLNFPNCDICMECRVVNSTSKIRVLLWLDERSAFTTDERRQTSSLTDFVLFSLSLIVSLKTRKKIPCNFTWTVSFLIAVFYHLFFNWKWVAQSGDWNLQLFNFCLTKAFSFLSKG